ncbi:MAG: twin-arginine translocase subunit TatC [Hyphomonadaceae bacterium]|nr:twin-arginine translocase subunit TatC [Hyphomonadaceae bacterium]
MSGAADIPDEVEASRAPLMDHLLELRNRLFVVVVAVVVATAACFVFAQQIYLFLVEPYRAAFAQVNNIPLNEAQVDLQITSPLEGFYTNLKLSLFAGVIVAFPVIAWQAYAFVAPGLYKREKQAAAPFLVAAPVMFGLGCAFVYYVAMPYAMQFALGTTVSSGNVRIALNAKVSEYFGLVTTLILAFGFVFQVPVVLSLLGAAGVVDSGMLRKGRRYAILAIAIFSAMVTPPEPISMMIMAIPVYLLYEASIWIVWLIEKARARAEGGIAPVGR